MAEADIDVAFLPYRCRQANGGIELIEKHLRGEVHVACHVHVDVAEEVAEFLRREFLGEVLFVGAMETRSYGSLAGR